MLYPYWVRFISGRAVCVEDESEEAAIEQARKLTGRDPVGAKRLPYPANPRISIRQSDQWTFCLTPEICAGRGSCPRDRACDD